LKTAASFEDLLHSDEANSGEPDFGFGTEWNRIEFWQDVSAGERPDRTADASLFRAALGDSHLVD